METITQKKHGVTLKFEFGDEDALFSYNDRSGALSSRFRYEDVDVAKPTSATMRYSYFYRTGMFLYMFSLAVALLHPSFFPHLTEVAGTAIDVISSVLILSGIALCLWRVEVRYTLLNVADGKIRIMDGTHHDRIMEMIKTRWRARMRELHGFVNFANDREKEMQKFAWLKQIGVIDAEEFQSFTEKLRLFMPKTSFRNPVTRPENLVH
ncbi:MAG TPA: hypothetical protein VFT64_00140 [Rickettsiales bacterium]|nr:hypothetical protein [Rickettsiales bacterium]